MEILLALKSRLKYFYEQSVDSCTALSYLAQDLTTLSDKYPKIYNSLWIGDITSMYLMTNSTVRVIMLTGDKRLIIGRINGSSVIVDKLECGIMDDSILLTEAKIVIVL